ncbi:MAG: GIY-YIG nuclease family protein [Actinobacteria bacterium]|nr:GIY-YIG nuclease family protein [Actinomycetota bacterium]
MIVTKAHILDEIKRTAEANGGQPLGLQKFYAETGIKQADWSGKYWARWSDALREAGYSPNRLQSAYNEQFLLEKLAAFVQELGHFPVSAELQLKSRRDSEFPSRDTFSRRFGGKAELAARLIAFCQQRDDYEDVVVICAPVSSNSASEAARNGTEGFETFGFVYLLKFGRYYKIGRTNAVGRRERKLAIQLPERANIVHSIKTDNPSGIEAYWHARFKDNRKNGLRSFEYGFMTRG